MNDRAGKTKPARTLKLKIPWREMLLVYDYRINILDSIMDMMEKYARNMEENVEERAQQLLEEKRKTDRLLYRLLPA